MAKTMKSVVVVAALAMATVAIGAEQALAQGTDTSAPTAKQQRKAQRKAARAKKNAQLNTLEKNGFQPGGDPAHYPDNIQDAEKKSGMGAASAP